MKPGPGDWEIGRLVLAPAYRSDVEALRHCLRLALEYVREQDNIERLFATCTHVLSRLYRRFAFRAFAHEVPLQGTSKTYTLISGCAEEISRTIADRSATSTQ
jgi:predicted GNAT family N-acyltransferase